MVLVYLLHPVYWIRALYFFTILRSVFLLPSANSTPCSFFMHWYTKSLHSIHLPGKVFHPLDLRVSDCVLWLIIAVVLYAHLLPVEKDTGAKGRFTRLENADPFLIGRNKSIQQTTNCDDINGVKLCLYSSMWPVSSCPTLTTRDHLSSYRCSPVGFSYPVDFLPSSVCTPLLFASTHQQAAPDVFHVHSSRDKISSPDFFAISMLPDSDWLRNWFSSVPFRFFFVLFIFF